jgi:hypothetical protein
MTETTELPPEPFRPLVRSFVVRGVGCPGDALVAPRVPDFAINLREPHPVARRNVVSKVATAMPDGSFLVEVTYAAAPDPK